MKNAITRRLAALLALAVMLTLCPVALAEGMTIIDEAAAAPIEPDVEEQALELGGDAAEPDAIEANAVAANDGEVAIDEINFPDANFRAYVQSAFDKDGSGTLSQEEIDKAKYIYCDNKAISSLKGVEFFTALTDLYCYSNQLTTLDHWMSVTPPR